MLKLLIFGCIVGCKVFVGLGLDVVCYVFCGVVLVFEVLLFWYCCLGLDVFEVYGMIENSGYFYVCWFGR